MNALSMGSLSRVLRNFRVPTEYRLRYSFCNAKINDMNGLTTFSDLQVNLSGQSYVSVEDSIKCAFKTLDKMLDTRDDSLVGKSFKNKYDMFRRDDDVDEMLLEMYNCFRIMRNTYEHSGLLTPGESRLSFRSGRGEVFDTSFYHFIGMFSFIKYYLDNIDKIGNYQQWFLKNIYKIFYDKCLISKNNVKVNLKQVLPDVCAKKMQRYSCRLDTVETDGDSVYLPNNIQRGDESNWTHCIDFIFNLNGTEYRIPEEFLDSSFVINKNTLVDFEV